MLSTSVQKTLEISFARLRRAKEISKDKLAASGGKLVFKNLSKRHVGNISQ
jgi:hypothetical protein